jgi:hypothetical protein
MRICCMGKRHLFAKSCVVGGCANVVCFVLVDLSQLTHSEPQQKASQLKLLTSFKITKYYNHCINVELVHAYVHTDLPMKP